MLDRLVVYGGCQSISLSIVLNCMPALRERFEVILHQEGERDTGYHTWPRDISRAKAILVQRIPQLDNYRNDITKFAPAAAVLEYPMLSFLPLWPFSTEFAGSDSVAESINASRSEPGLHYFDSLLARFREVHDAEKRLHAYCTFDDCGLKAVRKLISTRKPERLLELESIRLRNSDLEGRSNVGRFILHNFRSRRLFHTIYHPGIEVIYMAARELVERLRLDPTLDRPPSDCMAYYQIPIHPRVAEALGVTWVQPGTRYNVYDKSYTFEEYVRQYLNEFG